VDHGLQEAGRWSFPGSGSVVGTRGDDVFVQVSFAQEPNSSSVAYSVTAVSENSSTAEAARNDVRSTIVNWNAID
jgi:hypothetical protein